MYRYVDAAFSHWRLVCMPPILVVLLSVSMGVVMARSHDVTARIWVDPAILTNVSGTPPGGKQPNEIEGSAMLEWLSTSMFVKELITRVGLEQAVADREWPRPSWLEGQLGALPEVGPPIRALLFSRPDDSLPVPERALEAVRRSLKVQWSGTRLIKVTYRGDDVELGVSLLDATIELFQEKRLASRASIAEAARVPPDEVLRGSQLRMIEAAEALRRFREQHLVVDGESLSAADQAELADLEARYAAARDSYGVAQERPQESRLAVIPTF